MNIHAMTLYHGSWVHPIQHLRPPVKRNRHRWDFAFDCPPPVDKECVYLTPDIEVARTYGPVVYEVDSAGIKLDRLQPDEWMLLTAQEGEEMAREISMGYKLMTAMFGEDDAATVTALMVACNLPNVVERARAERHRWPETLAKGAVAYRGCLRTLRVVEDRRSA